VLISRSFISLAIGSTSTINVIFVSLGGFSYPTLHAHLPPSLFTNVAPYIPPIDPSNASDTQNFDEAFLDMDPTIDNDPDPEVVTDSERERTEDDDRTDEESVKAPAAVSAKNSIDGVKEVEGPVVEETVDVFDGYSFKGRHSILLDDEEEDDGYDGVDEEEEANEATAALQALDPDTPPMINTTPVVVEEIRDDGSETGTIEIPNEGEGSPRPSVTSTAPETIATASITTDADSIVPSRGVQVKQPSESSEAPSTLPSLTTTSTPSGAIAESPATSPDSPTGLSAAYEKDDLDDVSVALRAPLPLTPIIETPGLPTVEEFESKVERRASVVVEEVDTSAVATPAAVTSALPAVKDESAAIKDEATTTNDEPAATKDEPAVTKEAPSTPKPARKTRREKSGVPALDRVLSGDGDTTEREEEDWDLIETPHGEERNGVKGNSLWQKGVVDRYRLAVFGKSTPQKHSSTPQKSGSTPQKNGTPQNGNTPQNGSTPQKGSGSNTRRIPRSVSGTTFDSEVTDAPTSPSPSEAKHRRGRTAGLSLRKSTKQFLRARSPTAVFSVSSSANSRASLGQSATAMSVNSAGLLTPSPSGMVGPSKPLSTAHSLKSKSSALSKNSVGSPGSSDQSTADLRNVNKSAADIVTPAKSPASPRLTPTDESDKPHLQFKKMKKFTEGKMLSLFSSSPRSQSAHRSEPSPHS